MATRKPKRFADGGDTEFGDLEGAMDAANARAVQDQFDANEKASASSKAPAATPRAEPKPAAAPSKPAASTSKPAAMKDDQYNPDVKPRKKEMYRSMSGKMVEKAPASDTFKGMRESIGSGLKSAGEGIGSYLKSLGNREEKHGTYVKDGKVVKYAGGGMTASKRADGIATKGKTRGKIC